LDKRISAAFVIMLFMLGTFAAPVSAHFTLGKFKGTYDFHDNDFDPHVAGVLAYVWPGAGPTAGALPGFAPYPGYQSPYPGGNPTGMQTHWYQLDSTYYAPFGAILTSTLTAGTAFNKMKVSGNPTIETAGTWVDGKDMTVPPVFEHGNKGDLIIALTATVIDKVGFKGTYTAVYIQIPPEFTTIKRNQVVCSWTNNYDLIDSGPEVMENLQGPLWNYILIYTDPGFPLVFDGETYWYYIRINGVTAPTIAGKYFFKIFMTDSPSTAPPVSGDSAACPVENWPVLLVKGEVDPGIITGTIRFGAWNPALYGQAATLPGRVRAVGIADDPYTFKSTGRPVEARGYFNHDANGHYEVEGVAPGTYDVYASLAGYPEIKIASGVKVLKGQSAHVDGYLTPGVVIHGEVFSKCGTGEVTWKCGTYEALAWARDQRIKIEIYRSLEDAVATTPASSSTKAISWSPAYQSALEKRQFAWPGASGVPGYVDGDVYDPDGVGPDQAWDVLYTVANFKFQFGDKGLYGAPAEWTGHIPQFFATWTNGIPAGTFQIRAWTHGYLQTQADGFTFAPVTFSIASLEWPGDVYVPFDLFLGSYVVKEFHFHNVPGSLEDNGWDLPDAKRSSIYLYVQVYDSAKKQFGWAVRKFTSKAALAADVLKAVGVRGLLGRSVYKRSYGIPAGIYVVQGYAAGYLDQHPTTITIGLCGSEIRFSNHLDKGAQFDITVYSTDWEHPSVYKPWSWPLENIYVQIYKDGTALCRAGSYYDKTPLTVLPAPPFPVGLPTVPVYWGMPVLTQTSARNFVTVDGYYGAEARRPLTERADSSGRFPLAFETGTYSFKVFTYGYVQKKPFTVYVPKGAVADIPIKLLQGANITFDFIFKRESVIDHLRYDSAVRVRIFDDKGVLVGEALTSDYTKWFANAPLTVSEHPAQLQPVSKYGAGDYEWLNYIPSCTTRLHGLIAGLPDLYRGGYDPTTGIERISLYNLYSPDPYFDMTWTGSPIPAPYGIDAAPNYKGGWTIEVDVVPWYLNAFDVDMLVTRRTTSAVTTSSVTEIDSSTIFVTTSKTTFSVSNETVASATTYVTTNSSTVVSTTTLDYHATTTVSVPGQTTETRLYDTATTIIYVTTTMTTYTTSTTKTDATTVKYSTTSSSIYATTSEFGTTSYTTYRTTSSWTALFAHLHMPIYYPPPPGVLTGESPKYIPENHFGPYEQRVKVVIPGAHLGGEASVIFELDLRGLVQGTVYAYTHCGDWRAASWVTILALAADGKEYRWYSFDGAYEMWITPGTYTLHVIEWSPTKQEGHKVQTFAGFAVSEGSQLAMNFYLEQSGVPIPEFPVATIVLASALAASLFILRRRRKQ